MFKKLRIWGRRASLIGLKENARHQKLESGNPTNKSGTYEAPNYETNPASRSVSVKIIGQQKHDHVMT